MTIATIAVGITNTIMVTIVMCASDTSHRRETRHTSGHTRTGVWLRVGVDSVMVNFATFRRPEVGDTLAITTICAASSLEVAVRVTNARSTALVSFQFRAVIAGAALLRGPVVLHVVTVAPTSGSIAKSIVVTIGGCARVTDSGKSRWCLRRTISGRGGSGGWEVYQRGTAAGMRVEVGCIAPRGTTIRSPEVVVNTVARIAICITSSMVGAVNVIDSRCAALARIQLRARVHGAALVRGPVVLHVVTIARTSGSITISIEVTKIL